jgi:hypothetical protein
MKKITRIGAVFALLTTLGLVSVLNSTSGAAEDTSSVYVVHGIPGVNVDVYVNGDLTLPNFAPDTITDAIELPPADYEVKIFAATSPPPASAADRVDAAVITKTATVPAAGLNISLVAHLSASGTPELTPFVNDLSASDDAGNARVTVRHTAAAPAVDILVNGSKAIEALSNPNEASADVPGGDYDIAVAVSPSGPTVLELPGTTLPAGKNVIVYAIGDPSAGTPFGENSVAQDAPGTFKVLVQVLDLEAAEAPATTAPPTTAPVTTPPPVVQPTFTG